MVNINITEGKYQTDHPDPLTKTNQRTKQKVIMQEGKKGGIRDKLFKTF